MDNREQHTTHNELTLREIQLEELAMLDTLRAFCESNKFRMYLLGGSLLGAIRHHGFIPWDDDIDVCMPRPDYDSFLTMKSEFEQVTSLLVFGYQNCNIESSPYLKIVNPNIKTHDHRSNVSGFLWLDVLPIDGMPIDNNEFGQFQSRLNRERSLLTWLTVDPKTSRNPAKRVVKTFVRQFGRLNRIIEHFANRLNIDAQRYAYADSDYVGAASWGLYGAGERMKKTEFEIPDDVVFENRTFRTMSCWDSYLRGIYGDYMTPPEQSKQIAHELKAWRISS